MPTQRLSKRRIKEALRLKYGQGLLERAIARTLASNGAAYSYLRRAETAGLNWPLPVGMSDENLFLSYCCSLRRSLRRRTPSDPFPTGVMSTRSCADPPRPAGCCGTSIVPPIPMDSATQGSARPTTP